MTCKHVFICDGGYGRKRCCACDKIVCAECLKEIKKGETVYFGLCKICQDEWERQGIHELM